KTRCRRLHRKTSAPMDPVRSRVGARFLPEAAAAPPGLEMINVASRARRFSGGTRAAIGIQRRGTMGSKLFRLLCLENPDAVTGGFSDVTRGPGSVDVTTYGAYSLPQADRAGVDAANDYLRDNPNEDSVDVTVHSQDAQGTDWNTYGGWTREDMNSIDPGSLAPDRDVQGGFDNDNGEGGGSGDRVADGGFDGGDGGIG